MCVDGVIVDRNGQRLAGKRTDRNRREPIGSFAVGEFHVKSLDDGVAAGDGNIDFLSGVVNGKHQPRFRGGDGE